MSRDSAYHRRHAQLDRINSNYGAAAHRALDDRLLLEAGYDVDAEDDWDERRARLWQIDRNYRRAQHDALDDELIAEHQAE